MYDAFLSFQRCIMRHIVAETHDYVSLQPCLFMACILCLAGCTTFSSSNSLDGPSPEKTPYEELASFNIEPGLNIQLVAAEPLIQDPVVITFDADGRLWVVEMRGFMPTIDGEGEREPVGRVSVLEDTDGDGQMDVSKIYIDSLIMPRAIALVPGGALIVEKEALWLTQDTDGNLQADTKTLIDPDYAGSKLPEHSGNGLWRGTDNWYYNAKSRLRYRLVAGTWQRDSTEFRGQWGISHDDAGRLFYNYNWSQLHADLVPPNYLSRNLQALASIFEWPGSVSADSTVQKQNPLSEQEKQQFALGRQYYLSTCSGCHGTDGAGLNRFAPPLKGSEWVLGDEKRLSLILLHGIEGPLEVAGRVYENFHSPEAFQEFQRNSLVSLQIAEPIVRKHKMKLAVENHKDWRADELVNILQKLNSEWIGVTLDFENTLSD